jgi:2-oxo-4-hydroxy-4-carboxy-5-ureidoimidazoline decarboxylase
MKANNDEKLCLIRAHPDLVGRELLTAESQREQTSAGLGELSPEEVDRFRRYNGEYREKFDFPFVICARLNKKEAILEAFPVRLQNSREKEIETALGEIFKIAELRLHDLVK